MNDQSTDPADNGNPPNETLRDRLANVLPTPAAPPTLPQGTANAPLRSLSNLQELLARALAAGDVSSLDHAAKILRQNAKLYASIGDISVDPLRDKVDFALAQALEDSLTAGSSITSTIYEAARDLNTIYHDQQYRDLEQRIYAAWKATNAP